MTLTPAPALPRGLNPSTGVIDLTADPDASNGGGSPGVIDLTSPEPRTRRRRRAIEPPPESNGVWPLVSVLVRTGTGVEAVANTARATLACSYPNLEVCLVEDGTVAGLRAFAARLAREDRRVRVVTLDAPVAGPRGALLAAARRASGDVFAFIDPGAGIETGELEQAVRSIIGGTGAGTVTGGFVWLTDGRARSVNRYTIPASRGRRSLALDQVLYDILLAQLGGGEEFGSPPIDPFATRAHRRFDVLFRIALTALGLALFGVLVVTKSGNLGSRNTSLPLLVYTIFVTSFMLSRLAGAVFYPRVRRRISRAHPDAPVGVYEPTVSFVIPCMNEEGAIETTITKCLEADYPAEKVEIIVVNDGSTDTTLGALLELQERYDRVQIIDWRTNRGKRHGMAEGFRRATGEIIVQLDSDSYIDPRALHTFVQPFQNPEIGAVCAHADPLNADRNLLTKMQAAYYFMSFRIMKAAESSFMIVFCCSGCSSAYRRELVLPVLDDWLSETFLGKPVTWGDDRALTNRVLKAGYRTVYTDEARALTICPENMKTLLKQQVRWKKGWFVNSMFAAPFVMRRYPFVGLTYFFPLILLTLLTPFMAVRAFVYAPIMTGTFPWFYMVGVVLIASLITVFYRLVEPENKYWRYLFIWSALNMIVLSFILFYALFTIQNRRWGTR